MKAHTHDCVMQKAVEAANLVSWEVTAESYDVKVVASFTADGSSDASIMSNTDEKLKAHHGT